MLFHWQASQKEWKQGGVTWYLSGKAWEIYLWQAKKHSIRWNEQQGNMDLADDTTKVVKDVEAGLRVLFQYLALWPCGIDARKMGLAKFPIVFLAVDYYWQQVEPFADHGTIEAVHTMQAWLATRPHVKVAAQQAYNNWQSLVVV